MNKVLKFWELCQHVQPKHKIFIYRNPTLWFIYIDIHDIYLYKVWAQIHLKEIQQMISQAFFLFNFTKLALLWQTLQHAENLHKLK